MGLYWKVVFAEQPGLPSESREDVQEDRVTAWLQTRQTTDKLPGDVCSLPALGFWEGLCIRSTCPLYFAKSEWISIPATKQWLTEFIFP